MKFFATRTIIAAIAMAAPGLVLAAPTKCTTTLTGVADETTQVRESAISLLGNAGIIACTYTCTAVGSAVATLKIFDSVGNQAASEATVACTAANEVVVKGISTPFALGGTVTVDTGATAGNRPGYTLDCLCDIDPRRGPTGPTGPAATPASDEGCISGTSTVDVLEKGTTEVQDLQVGDRVLTSNGYEAVYAFAHFDVASKDQVYSQIHFEGMTKPLEATGRHLVYTAGKANPITVDALTLEDSLIGRNGETLKINKIEQVTRDGLFAPLTERGGLLVDGIKISSYTSLQKEGRGDEFAEFANGVALPFISQHMGIHMFLAPLRMACLSGLSTSVCDPSFYSSNGMPKYVTMGMNLASFVDQQSFLLQLFMLVVVLLVFGPLYALEVVFGAPMTPFVIALGAGALTYNRKHITANLKKVKTI